MQSKFARPNVSLRFRLLFPAILLCLLAPYIGAQTSEPAAMPAPNARVIQLGQPAVALNGPWKFRTGDSPRVEGSQRPLWAQPNYDDSGWQDYTIDPKHSKLSAVQALNSKELPGWQQHGHPGYTGYAWYRIRLQTAPDVKSLVLLMPQYFDDIYEVYANGQKIGAFGKLDGFRIIYENRPVVFRIPEVLLQNGQPVNLAIRFLALPGDALPSQHNLDGGLRGAPLVGPKALLDLFQQHLREKVSQTLGSARINLALYVAVGLISLFLFFFSRSQREYLWAGVTLLGLQTTLTLPIIAGNANLTAQSIVFLFYFGFWIGISAAPFALMYLLQVPKNFWRRGTYVVSGVLAINFCVGAAISFGMLPPTAGSERLGHVLGYIAFIGVALLLFGILVDGVRTLGRKAWLPLTPGLFLLVLFADEIAETIFPKLGSSVLDPLWRGCLYGIPLAVLVVFLVRFTRQERENAQMTSELEAARTMQSLLVPAVSPSTPGFAVESVYLPASSVGGDFFQVQPGVDGSLLVVVGDVSGKGLKAAMMVSTIIGALRDYPTRRPAEILVHLNRVLHGQISGFVTCCATLITADGSMTIANAGHLSPYRNGEELHVAGGLPLGILAEDSYEETHYQLAPGDRLTFMSDGVVEARNPKGELYGFERTQQISNQRANTITEAAKQFGQEDDITVVTVTRNLEAIHAV